MLNQELVKIFNQMALYFEMDDVPFKPQAYEKAAVNLDVLPNDVGDIYEKEGIEGLRKIPGVGQHIADKIVEYIKTGKIKAYSDLKKKIPVDIDELTAVEGVGPKKIKELYGLLKIKNLKDLERAAKGGKIRSLPRFGLKTEQNILESIGFLKRSHGRFLLGEILPTVRKIIGDLKKLKPARTTGIVPRQNDFVGLESGGEVKQISEAGSVRRRKETIGDVDILITGSDPKKVINYFVSLPGVVKIWGKGPTKASIRLKDGLDIDLRVLPENQFGSALQYFTGSKEHNIILRKIAIDKKYKLSEYGLFRGAKIIAGKTEEDIYKKLGMDYIEPELRENTGEIEAALAGKLPKLISYNDILGDLHIQTNWNGGENSIEEMADTAIKMGYQYIGISDHTKFLRIENGLDEKQLMLQRKEIDKLNSRFILYASRFRILHGCEANIMADGSIDIKDEALAKLDYVIAGVHSQLKMPKEKMTKRIIKAMKNLHVDIISHPTGRILKKRDEYEVDFDKILSAAKETGTVLEINSMPKRLDLKDVDIRKAKNAGVKMVINTDAHHKDHMSLIKYGISQARRGWAEKKDIVNAWSVDKMLKMLK